MKKTLAIILAVMLLLSVLAACDNAQGGGEATPTPAQTDSTPTPGVDVTEGGKYMDADYPYEDIKLPAYKDFTDTTVTIISNNDYRPDPTKADAIVDIYNLSYEGMVTTVEQYGTTFISMFMADESPELCAFGTPISMINKGYFMPLEEIIDFDLPLWSEIKGSIENSYYKNHVYSINSAVGRGGALVYYNTALFEEAGMKTPREYYDEGNWTWDTFRQLAMDMNIDSDSDGVPEVYGCYAEAGMYLYSSGVDYITVNKDGTIVNNVMSDSISRAVNAYAEIMSLPCAYMGSSAAVDFNNGKIAMMNTEAWVRVLIPDIIKAGNAAVVPCPRDPSADAYYILEDFTTSVGYSIPSNSKNANAAAAFLCGLRYNRVISERDTTDADELKAMSVSEQIEKLGWPYEFEEFLNNEFYKSDKFETVTSVAMNFKFANQFAGDFWFRPLAGEPWATVAAEIEPLINDYLEDIMEGE